MPASPIAAASLIEEIGNGASYIDSDELMGETDCPDGCTVEPDGKCPHGYLSAGRTAGLI